MNAEIIPDYEDIACPKCGAAGGQTCTTRSGKDHAARIKAEQENHGFSSSLYTPTTEEIEQALFEHYGRGLHALAEEAQAVVKRALAEHDREVAATALEQAADAMDIDPTFRDPLRLKADWVRARAVEIRNGEHQ